MAIVEQEDTILIQNILEGNLGAQETLYNKYRKIVKDYILSKYSTYYDIDDDVSEIMIKIFLNLRKFNHNKSKFKTWVITITKNYIIDKWRISSRVKNESLSSCDYSNSYFTTSNATTDLTPCAFENINTLNFISTQISPSDYTLLEMKYIQGYNYNEIGNEFQLTSSTISNKINYIKTKLKKCIHEDICD